MRLGLCKLYDRAGIIILFGSRYPICYDIILNIISKVPQDQIFKYIGDALIHASQKCNIKLIEYYIKHYSQHIAHSYIYYSVISCIFYNTSNELLYKPCLEIFIKHKDLYNKHIGNKLDVVLNNCTSIIGLDQYHNDAIYNTIKQIYTIE